MALLEKILIGVTELNPFENGNMHATVIAGLFIADIIDVLRQC